MAQSQAGPEIELDWEMGVFRGLRALWNAVRPKRAPAFDDGRAAQLSDLSERLTWLAGLIAGRPLRIGPARSTGGIRGDDLLLPTWIEVGPDIEINASLYVLRTVVDATTAARNPQLPRDGADLAAASRDEALASIAELSAEMAMFAPAWDEAVALVAAHQGDGEPPLLWGRLIAIHDEGAGPGDHDEGTRPPSSDASEAVAHAVEELTVLDLNPEEAMEVPIHSFEKVEMAEAFNGSLRQLDGEDDLNAHLEALDEVDLGALMRGGPQAHSVMRADIAMDAHVPDVDRVEPGETALSYDEWDGAKRAWKKDWCQVYPTLLPATGIAEPPSPELMRLVRTLEDRLLRHRTERSTLNRQLDGDDIDLDAVIDAACTRASGHAPTNRVYSRRPRTRRDVATTVLLDISLSADAWVDNRRVLDVAKDAVVVLGEVAERLGDRLQILAFASSTRHRVRVFTVQDWNEPWSLGQRRLNALRPQGYTRLGAAIRHATDRLDEVDATQRVLLLITDGKPTDWDRYEGRYGVHDVRMALRQARNKGVAAHALAIDDAARAHLPTMLGPGRWDVLRHPDELIEALTRVYGLLG